MRALKCNCCVKESRAKNAPETISIVIGFFFFINYIVGVGFLGIPSVFRGAGLLTALLTLLAISLLAWTTITWLLEVMSRAQVSVFRTCTAASVHLMGGDGKHHT